jgi:GNAT superfamily N-acetyltransferase
MLHMNMNEIVTTSLADLIIRKAVWADRESLLELHERTLRQPGPGGALTYYRAAQIEALMASGTLDEEMVWEGRYCVAELDGETLGCGGWSRRVPGYLAADPNAEEMPRLRAMFVAPTHARRGIGSRLARHIEADVLANGQPQLALDALLSGVPLYRALGYQPVHHGLARLPGAEVLRYLHMRKWLDVTASAPA